MTEPDVSPLTARIAQLERRLRRTIGVVVGIALAGVLALGGAAIVVTAIATSTPLPGLGRLHLAGVHQGDVVKSERFEIIDKQGKVLGTFGLDKHYGLSLVLANSQGTPSVVLAGGQHPDLQLNGRTLGQQLLITLDMIEIFGLHGKATLDALGPELDLRGNQGHVLARLDATGGSPELVLHDSSTKAKVKLDVAPSTSELSLFGAQGKQQGGFFITPDGPELGLGDAQGHMRIKLNLLQNGRPHIDLLDANGPRRLVLGSVALTSKTRGGITVTPSSSITAFDKAGKVIGQWP